MKSSESKVIGILEMFQTVFTGDLWYSNLTDVYKQMAVFLPEVIFLEVCCDFGRFVDLKETVVKEDKLLFKAVKNHL